MTAAYFEDHPTDPDKVILRKPRLDQGLDYERGFIDGMQYQMQSSVDKAVNAMSQRTWVELTDKEIKALANRANDIEIPMTGRMWIFVGELMDKLKEKNT